MAHTLFQGVMWQSISSKWKIDKHKTMLQAVKDLYVLTCYWNFHKLQNNQQTFLKMFSVCLVIMYQIICIHSILCFGYLFLSLLLFCVQVIFTIQDRYHYSQIREMQKFSMISTLRLQWDVITQHFKQTLLNIIDLALIYISSDVLHWTRWSNEACVCIRYANQILYMLT